MPDPVDSDTKFAGRGQGRQQSRQGSPRSADLPSSETGDDRCRRRRRYGWSQMLAPDRCGVTN